LKHRFIEVCIVKENFTEFKLQYWADTYKKIPPPKDLLSLQESFGLTKGYSFGLRDLKWTRGSLFSLSGQSLEHHIRTETILSYIIPHVHQTLVRISDQHDQEALRKVPDFSQREIEILNWLKSGKTTWDISILLKVSERTVKFHVTNIMKKLNATNRVHAVAVAIGRGLIEVD
jgi:DNA-binding CsgD family transcriptional regulator